MAMNGGIWESFAFLVLFFSLFSFLGWILETIFRSIQQKKFVNAGFLYGPFVPIYGFGCLTLFLLNSAFGFLPVWVLFVVYMAGATILEYVASAIMERLFSLKLWDYSHLPLHINGRVCALFSLAWGFLGLFYSFVLEKPALRLLGTVPVTAGIILSILLTVYFFIDSFYSSRLYLRFSQLVRELLEKSDWSSLPHLLTEKIREKLPTRILRPLVKFPALVRQFQTRWTSFAGQSISKWRSAARPFYSVSEMEIFLRNDPVTAPVVTPVLDHPAFQELKRYRHHHTTIYDHNIIVAYLSYRFAGILPVNKSALLRGALLHDFFFYDWRTEKPPSGKLHAFEHPRISLANARQHFDSLTPAECDIITKHMWPLTVDPPRHLETLVVSMADKAAAVMEYIEASRS